MVTSQGIATADALYNAGKTREAKAQAANPLIEDGLKLLPSVTRTLTRHAALWRVECTRMHPLFHFSEDPTITRFRPHVAGTSNEAESLVWAIDHEHAPSYWFPRDCPRACCWAGEDAISEAGASLLGLGGARRLHAIEAAWLPRMRECRLYQYEFDPELFKSKVAEAGYWVSDEEVTPLSVSVVGDLLSRHAEAGIEVRIVSNLWPLIDAIVASGLEFSIIRKANAQQP